MYSRREFLVSTAAAGMAHLMLAGTSLGAPQSRPGLRTITYNVLKCLGYSPVPEAREFLEKGQPQVPTRLALELALYEPDIVTFQEAPPEETIALIAGKMGMRYAFFKGGWHGAILSKHQITAVRNCPLASWSVRPKDLFTRHWGRAVVRAPGGDIEFFSAHMHPSDESIRAREVDEMLKVIGPELQKGGRVILQGDLNHEPSGPEYRRWADAGLVDVFAKTPATGTIDKTFDCHKPFKRIDYIWVSSVLAAKARTCRILHERAFRTNDQDPKSVALSDHIPIMGEFDL